MAVFVLFQPTEGAAAVLVRDLGQTLAKVVLIDAGMAMVEVTTGFRAHDIEAVVAIGVARFWTDVVAALLVVATRGGKVCDGFVDATHRSGRWHERFRLLMLA
jgi:hypothetical protein